MQAKDLLLVMIGHLNGRDFVVVISITGLFILLR